jgi:hypothetical protein
VRRKEEIGTGTRKQSEGLSTDDGTSIAQKHNTNKIIMEEGREAEFYRDWVSNSQI